MDFENASAFPAELVRSSLSPDDSEPMLAVVALKVAYAVAEDGTVRMAAEQSPVSLEAQETEYGVLPPDVAPTKPAFDVMVLGKAKAPGRSPATQMTVRLEVGHAVRELAVFGDRRWMLEAPKKRKPWQKKGPEEEPVYTAGPPEPFIEMPLTYAHAYGGQAKVGVYEAPNPYNAAGKGFCMEAEAADGLALPNIEDPRALIRTWRDQPKPAGFAPLPLSTLFTVERGVTYDPETKQQTVLPEVFQNAHPELIFPEVPPGTQITLTGMTADGPFAFRLPDLSAAVTVRLEENEYRPEGKVDTLMIFPEERMFVLVHRTPFKYRVVPEQRRVTRLEVIATGAEGGPRT